MNRPLSALAGNPIAAGGGTQSMPEPSPPFRDTKLSVEQRVSDLLARMTPDEKIDQLHLCAIGDTNPNNLTTRSAELRPTYGSFIMGGGPKILETRNALQQQAVHQTRLGIPALFGADVIHGYRAILPIPLAQACSWDPSLVRKGAAMAANEASAHGVNWTFAPMVDHCVDARWGRIAETFGESPYAASVYCAASVKGYQGDQPGASGSIAACLKHYVGYGASEGGRDYSYSEIASQNLWEMHLPSFEAGVRAGVVSVMSAFNDLNGIPTSANRFTLTEILRERWGFNGLVVSDWNSVLQLIRQGFAADEAEAAAKAINAGVDIDMADGLYRRYLTELIAADRVSLATLDESVRRVLRVKFALGLFEHPLSEATTLTGAPPNPSQLELAEELAARSMVLLKNDGLLPLDGRHRRIAVIGPAACDGAALLGSWAQQGRPDETTSIFDELQKRAGSGVNVSAALGCSFEKSDDTDITAAVALACRSDLTVLCLGEHQGMSGENGSRSSLRLAGRQEELALAVLVTGKPVVVVLVSGRPLEIQNLEPKAAAILAAWQGGTRAAAAMADLLFGRRNFSGRLSVTWPRTSGQIPIFHNLRPRARAGNEGAYGDILTTPLYEFGHGLSYSNFSYGPIRLDRAEVKKDGKLRAEIVVTNVGLRDGGETVFWFIRDPAASITRPLRELKFFEQASIKAGGSHVFRFEIEPRRDLSFPDANGQRVLEAGEIILMAGDYSEKFTVLP